MNPDISRKKGESSLFRRYSGCSYSLFLRYLYISRGFLAGRISRDAFTMIHLDTSLADDYRSWLLKRIRASDNLPGWIGYSIGQHTDKMEKDVVGKLNSGGDTPLRRRRKYNAVYESELEEKTKSQDKTGLP